MEPVTLINPFSVKLEEEKNFMVLWKRVDDYLRTQEGFISTKLHKSLDDQTRLPPATFRFINVALWQSIEAFEKAVMCEKFKNARARFSLTPEAQGCITLSLIKPI